MCDTQDALHQRATTAPTAGAWRREGAMPSECERDECGGWGPFLMTMEVGNVHAVCVIEGRYDGRVSAETQREFMELAERGRL
jgi:hypothetical protein